MARRNLLARSTFLFAATALLFGTIAAAPAKAAPKITLNIWTFGNVIEPKMKARYEKMHPNIKIVAVNKGGPDQLAQALIVAFQAHKTPDIAAIETSWSGLFRDYPKNFVDLRSAPYNANSIKKNYVAWRWAQGTGKNGEVIGLPTDVGGLEVAYRVDLFKKAGFPTQRDAVGKMWPTWDKFIEVGKKYNAKMKRCIDKSKNKSCFMDSSGTIFQAVLNQGTEKFYKAPGQVDYQNRQVRNAFNQTGKALTAGIGSRIAPYSGDWYAGMNKGTFATLLAPAWQLDYIKQYAPKTKGLWDVARVPGGGGNIGGSQLSIPKSAPNKLEAWKFMSWYLAPAQQLTVFKEYGLFPSAKVLYTSSAVQNYKDPFFRNAPIGKIYAAGALKLKPIYEGPKERAIMSIYGQALGRIEARKQNTSQAWNQAVADIKTALNR